MDAVLNNLSKIGQLKVISRTSVEQYRNTTKTAPEIARELGVSYILVGSAQKYGQEIRITTQLISAETDGNMWSQEYTRTFKDVLLLQSEIAEKVADELKATLTSKEQEELRKFPTKVPEAFNSYILANFQLRKSTKEGFQKATLLYEKAIEIDPKYVDAYVGLAEQWQTGGLVWGIYNEVEAKVQATTLLKQALKLDAEHAGAHSLIATVYFYYDWNFDSALEHFQLVKKITGHESVFSRDYHIKIGDFKTALSTIEYFIENYPSTSSNYSFKAITEYFLGNQSKAIQTQDKAYQLFDDFWFLRDAAKLYYNLGELEKSKSSLEKLKSNFPDRPLIVVWLDAVHAYHEGGDNQVYQNQIRQNV